MSANLDRGRRASRESVLRARTHFERARERDAGVAASAALGRLAPNESYMYVYMYMYMCTCRRRPFPIISY